MIPPRGDKKQTLRKLQYMGYYGNRELVRKARVLRSNMTRAEIILWSRLRAKKINGYHILRLSNLEIETDIYSATNKIISYITENLSPSQGDHRGSNE